MKNIFKTLAVLALLVISTSVFAASFDAFLEIEGVKGECKGKVYKGTIDKNGMVKIPKVLPGEFNVKMCATGTHIKSAKLFVRKQGTEQHDYFTIEISSFSFGATQTQTNSGGVRVAAGDVNGDGRADIITSADKGATAAGGGGGAGKASFQDLHFSMKTSDGKTAAYGGGGATGKVQFQDFHFTMKPASARGKDMYEGQIGTVELVGPSDNQSRGNAFFDVFVDLD